MSEEITTLRTETGKLYGEPKDPKSGAPRYTQEAVTGPIHFKETYGDGEGWQDIDRAYNEPGTAADGAPCLVYPKLPNIVRVFTDRLGYEIQSRSNPDHVARVELVAIDGISLTRIPDASKIAAFIRVHPRRVGLWKDFSQIAKAKDHTLRWKVTEHGNKDRDSHPFAFRETPEAYTVADITNLDPMAMEQAKVAIQTQRTRIDDTSWHWDEIIPSGAKLVDTDYTVGAGADDGYWYVGFGAPDNNDDYVYLSGPYQMYARFTSVAISPGSTINSAVLTLVKYAGTSGTTVTKIHMNDEDDAVVPTSLEEADALVYTTENSGDWTVPSDASGTFDTPSLVSPVQEVVDRAGWTSGNAMMALSKYPTQFQSDRRFASYDHATDAPPILTVTWTEPSTGHPASKRMGGIPFAAIRGGVW